MMEYSFVFYDPKTFRPLDIHNPNDSTIIATFGYKALGFQSQNIGHAKITGFDITVTGMGSFFGIPATLLCGYTYTNPIDLNEHDSSKSTSSNMLKYRYYHSIKADF